VLLHREYTVESVTLTAISTYEAAALISGRLPTITTLTMRLPRILRAVIVSGVAYWLVNHFEVTS
jgi:hypothetical protein